MNNTILIIGAGALWIVVSIFQTIKDWRKGRLLYSLKCTINGTRPLIIIIGAMYIIILGVLPIPSLIKLVQSSKESSKLTDTLWVYDSIPMAYTLIIILLSLYILTKSYKPFIKYTEKELEYKRESFEKMRSKLPKWIARFVKEPKEENIL